MKVCPRPNRKSVFPCVAYGLGIRSALPLPEFVASAAAADVDVRLGRVKRFPSETTAAGSYFRATAEEAYLFWENVGAFLVLEGREIIADPVPGVEDRVLRLFILGPALGVLLHQRGLLVLHASAVELNGGAVAFLGGAGWGKSTLAAALYARGHGVMSDDVTAVELDGPRPTALPGFPQLKLWPEAAAALGVSPATLARLHPQLEKRAYDASRGFPEAPLPLSRIYVLAEGMSQEVEPIRPQEALLELVRHSYGIRMLQAVRPSSHFRQCAALASTVPVCRLKVRCSLASLPDLARFVEDDLSHAIG